MSIRQHLIRTSHHVTWFLGRRFPDAIPLVFVVAYPRSGTTWVTQLVGDYLGLPFPRLSILPVGFAAAVHGHDRVHKGYSRGVYVVRDGRDALTSCYWRWRRLPRSRKSRFVEDVAGFVEWQLTTWKPLSSPVTWPRHVRSYFEVGNPNMVFVRYEDLLRDGEATLARLVAELTGEPPDLERVREAIERFSFKRQAGRPAGVEQRTSWHRKGQAGDWSNLFTPEAAEVFDRHAGDLLIEMGYEDDRSWVQRFRQEYEERQAEALVSAEGGGDG